MARINRHPEVGRHLNRPVDQQAIAAFYSQMTDHWETHGYGPWALESTEPGLEGRFAGFAGLADSFYVEQSTATSSAVHS